MAGADPPSEKKWWGEFRLEEGELGHWRIGPLDLWVRRTALDWRYGSQRGENFLDESLEVQVPASLAIKGKLPEEQGRFGFTRTDAGLELVPALANRPVVVRPSVPFSVQPGQEIELFVSTPLWIRLRAGGTDLAEVPCTRPSDTWFGSNTLGELCYATKTHLVRKLENVPLRPHRAVSHVTVVNAAGSPLVLERLSLPAPQLSLFVSPGETLWTEHVTLKREEDGDMAAVSLGKGAPRLAGEGNGVSSPRAPQGRSFGSLVFGGLFVSRT